jgi:hypothetical protein
VRPDHPTVAVKAANATRLTTTVVRLRIGPPR